MLDWQDTAIFVTWDDWGGWYDRVPRIVISPYAKCGFVSHTQYETASITRFIEDTFGLASLGQRDATATPPADMFDFTQSVKPLAQL